MKKNIALKKDQAAAVQDLVEHGITRDVAERSIERVAASRSHGVQIRRTEFVVLIERQWFGGGIWLGYFPPEKAPRLPRRAKRSSGGKE